MVFVIVDDSCPSEAYLFITETFAVM
jgi:hypothetical protein